MPGLAKHLEQLSHEFLGLGQVFGVRYGCIWGASGIYQGCKGVYERCVSAV